MAFLYSQSNSFSVNPCGIKTKFMAFIFFQSGLSCPYLWASLYISVPGKGVNLLMLMISKGSLLARSMVSGVTVFTLASHVQLILRFLSIILSQIALSLALEAAKRSS